METLSAFAILLQQLWLQRADAALAVSDRAFGEPYGIGDMRMCDIRPVDIVRWQNALTGFTRADGNNFKPTYLRIIKNQLNAIFNHAERYYNLE